MTTLLWKSRVSRKKKAETLEAVTQIFKDAKDTGEGIEVAVDKSNQKALSKAVWVFLLSQSFRGIREA